MILLIDNYDSFVYNLYQYLGELQQKTAVFRNDVITVEEIKALNPSHIIISPGPCTPNEAGNSLSIVRRFAGSIPILGVCLGHQVIGQAFGGKVVRASRPMHGKTSLVYHDESKIYRELPNPLVAARYHSLVVEKASLPDELEVTAVTGRGELMGIRHRLYTVEGVQFHPESIITKCGRKLLANFLEYRGGFWYDDRKITAGQRNFYQT